jgi:hypothetical protein
MASLALCFETTNYNIPSKGIFYSLLVRLAIRNTETRDVLFLLRDLRSDTGSQDTSPRYKQSQIFAFFPAEPFFPGLLPCIWFLRPRGDSIRKLMKITEWDLVFSRRWTSQLNTDFWFWGFCTVCKINFPTTFRDPQRLPKRCWEIYLAYRAKSPKPKNQYSFHCKSLKSRSQLKSRKSLPVWRHDVNLSCCERSIYGLASVFSFTFLSTPFHFNLIYISVLRAFCF